MALREMGFAAKKASAVSGRLDTAASAVMIRVRGLKWVPDAPDSWKPGVKGLVERVIPAAPFQQLMYAFAFVALLSMCPSRPVTTPANMPVARAQVGTAELRTTTRRRNSWNGGEHSSVATGVSV